MVTRRQPEDAQEEAVADNLYAHGQRKADGMTMRSICSVSRAPKLSCPAGHGKYRSAIPIAISIPPARGRFRA